MTKPYTGKVALVTGGTRGIGAATAFALAEAGADVAVFYYNSSDLADDVVQKISALGQKAIAIRANVADHASVKEAFLTFREHFEHLDFLISNAASGVLKPAMEMSTKHWRWCMETNALALNHLASEARNMMPRNSRIIALSSLGAIRAIPNYAFIGASKAALEALARSLSLELAPQEITVNVISAGVVDTDALKHFPNREHLLEEYKERSLCGRALTAEDVAQGIVWMCRPEAQMVNGQTIFLDAGYSIIG